MINGIFSSLTGIFNRMRPYQLNQLTTRTVTITLVACGAICSLGYYVYQQLKHGSGLSFRSMGFSPSFPEKISIEGVGGKMFEGVLQLIPGQHKIILQHGDKKGQLSDITIAQPIYVFPSAQLGRMQAPRKCLLMSNDVFQCLKNTIHAGAFGGDYCDVGNGKKVVWKIPADLLYIDAYKADTAPNHVGTYGLSTDAFSMEDPTGLGLLNKPATKLRRDFKSQKESTDFTVTSVHSFEVDCGSGGELTVPGISTGNFFKDFYSPTTSEQEKVNEMLEALIKLGIFAFSCNAAHHAIIVYGQKKDESSYELMTPAKFAALLKENDAIFGAIQKAANKDLKLWKEAFISLVNV